jgi:hypothetical protein
MAYNDGRIKISELPTAAGIQTGDMFPAAQPNVIDPQTQQPGATSKITAQQLMAYIAGNSTVINAVQGIVAVESGNRQQADTELAQALTDEATARQTADQTLQGNILAEAAARTNADNAKVDKLTNHTDAGTSFGIETNAEAENPVIGGMAGYMTASPVEGSRRLLFVKDAVGNIRIHLRKDKPAPTQTSNLDNSDTVLNSGEIQVIVNDIMAAMSQGLKTPGVIDKESHLPDASGVPNGTYYAVQDLDVTAPGQQGRVWKNDTLSGTAWQVVIDNVFAPDDEWIALTEGGALTINPTIQELINGAIQSGTKGTASGVAPLDTQSEVPDEHLNVTLTDAAASDTQLPTTKTSIRSLLQSIRNGMKWLFANKIDKNGTDRLMTAAEGAKLADIQNGAQVNPGNATQSAAGLMSANDKTRPDSIADIIPLTVGLYTERAATSRDIYLRDDNFTFVFNNNYFVAYLKSGFVYISGYLQTGVSPEVPLYFGANKAIITIGNTAYKPAPKIDYIGTVGDYHTVPGDAGLSRLEMVRCENGSNDIKLGQNAPSAEQKPFLNYILLNIMYPIG